MRFAFQLAFLLMAVGSLAAEETKTQILIAFHSKTGNTEAQAKAVRDGAASASAVEVVMRKVGDVRPEDITKADGILVGTPVHWWNPSAETRQFLDRVAEALEKESKTLGEWRTAGVFCTGGAIASGKDLTRVSGLRLSCPCGLS